jgi:hypothetical protein
MNDGARAAGSPTVAPTMTLSATRLRARGKAWGVRAFDALAPAFRCQRCGGTAFRGIPVVWRGRLRIIGAARRIVAVDWESQDDLAFVHAVAADCPALRSPGPPAAG